MRERGSVVALVVFVGAASAGLAAPPPGILTQAELAKKLGVKQPIVSKAECGTGRVGERYIARVLKACGLPKDWAG